MISLRYAHLCDYAAIDAKSKPTIVGIFDIILDVAKERPVRLPPVAYFVAKIECSMGDGTQHHVELAVLHEDGEMVHRAELGTVQFRPTGPGRPLSAQFVIMLGGMPLPEVGDYTFEVKVDGRAVGDTPLYVIDAPSAHG